MKMYHAAIYMGPEKSPLTKNYCAPFICPRTEHFFFAGRRGRQPGTCHEKEGRTETFRKTTQIRVG